VDVATGAARGTWRGYWREEFWMTDEPRIEPISLGELGKAGDAIAKLMEWITRPVDPRSVGVRAHLVYFGLGRHPSFASLAEIASAAGVSREAVSKVGRSLAREYGIRFQFQALSGGTLSPAQGRKVGTTNAAARLRKVETGRAVGCARPGHSERATRVLPRR
jgi:hypothetical protein